MTTGLTNDQCKALVSQLEEYLGAFCLVGYAIDSSRVVIRAFKTRKDLDALQAAVCAGQVVIAEDQQKFTERYTNDRES